MALKDSDIAGPVMMNYKTKKLAGLGLCRGMYRKLLQFFLIYIYIYIYIYIPHGFVIFSFYRFSLENAQIFYKRNRLDNTDTDNNKILRPQASKM